MPTLFGDHERDPAGLIEVGPEAEVRIPAYSQQFDYELEWGVVIGRAGVDATPQKREMGGRLGPAKGKDFDTGNAIGPWLVTPDELPDPYALTMIAHISASETLHPGDFIGSGTVGRGCGLGVLRNRVVA